MARLTTVKPLIPKLQTRLIQPEAPRARDNAVTGDQWRKWYGTARWQALRLQAIVRDLQTCQKTGILLYGKHPAPDSPVVDHIIPHRGNPDLFWDLDNLQTVAKSWHDSIKQAIEKADQVAAIHPKWLQPSAIPLTIICGPPCSGKTTYAQTHAAKGDVVIDLDHIAHDISGEPIHGWDRTRWLNAALWRRNNMLGDLSRSDTGAAWFVVSEPKARHRDWWADTLKPKAIVVLEVEERECLRRAMADTARDINATETGITRWWAQYERRIGDLRPVAQ